MPWQVLVLISIVTVSAVNILQRVIMTKENKDPIAYSILFQFSLGFCFFIFVLFAGFKPLDFLKYKQFFILSSFLWALSVVMSFKAIKHIGASDMVIVTSSSSIVTVIASIIFLKEIFTKSQFVGLLLILLSVYLVNRVVRSEISLNVRGVIYALLSAFFAGLAVVSDIYILKENDLFSYLVLTTVFSGILMLLFSFKNVRTMPKLIGKKDLFIMLVFAGIYAVQAITYYGAVNAGADLSQVATIQKSNIILTVFLGIIFLKERQNIPVKLLALVLVVVGVLLVG